MANNVQKRALSAMLLITVGELVEDWDDVVQEWSDSYPVLKEIDPAEVPVIYGKWMSALPGTTKVWNPALTYPEKKDKE